MKAEHDGRVSAEEKLEESEQTLTNLTQENTTLQTKVSEMDKVWGAKLEEVQNKLQTAEAELNSLKQIIAQMLAALVGKLKILILFINSSFCVIFICYHTNLSSM